MQNAHFSRLYRSGFGLMTDLYQLTMAYGYWRNGLHDRRAVFHLFYRKNPFGHPYTIAAGLELTADYLQQFGFTAEDVQYLGSLKGSDGKALFNESFLNYLQRLSFSCHIDAIPEGTVVFPDQPLVRVEGPIIQCQLLETILLNQINFSTLIATKSARVVQAAQGDSVLEFGFRRAQGPDGALTAARSAYIGGCHATSNVLAGRLFGIPVKGTHAHSWVMCFDDELTAFRRYAQALPNNCIFLVDTYDTEEGVRNAIQVGRELRQEGHEMVGIRLDSGDLAELSITARRMLDEAGFTGAKIVASSDLDEHAIRELKARGAMITIWGVGTRLATAYDQPALGGVYKLSAIQDETGQWQYRVKLSDTEEKTSDPGIQQVRRFLTTEGLPAGDMTFNADNGDHYPSLYDRKTRKVFNFEGYESQDLLQPVFREGKMIMDWPSIQQIRERSLEQQEWFRKVDVANYPQGLETGLRSIKNELIRQHRAEVE